MTVSLTCRPASRADLPAILRLYAQPALDDGNVLGMPDAVSIFERISSYPDYRLYIALWDDQIVGTFAMLIMDNLAHLGAPSAVVEDVAVDPEFHGRGIGKKMMDYARELAAEKGCYKLVLSSNLVRERAHAFYESLGFERHGYSFRVNI